MLALLAFLALLLLARADTPAWCYDDQPQGTWEFEISGPITPVNDQISCADDFKATTTKRVILYSPNIAIDGDTGAAGTWTNVFSQYIEISVGGKRYAFAYAWDELPDNMIHSHCGRSQPGMGWTATDAVTPRDHACLRATLVEPTLSVIDNLHKRGEPGPVNPDAQTHRVMPERRLPAPVPTGETYRKLKAEGKLTYRPLGSRGGFSHKIFERLSREASASRSIPYQGDKLPDHFDWRDVDGKSYVPPPMDQEGCGSCFTFATLLAMMARVMVASDLQDPLGQTTFLSTEHALDCNFYSQGCSGGFGEHVVRFAQQFGILTKDAYYIDYESGSDGVTRQCQTPNDGAFLSRSGDRYFFTAGQLLGGYMGAVTDPTEMKWEIYRHGPMTVSIQANSNFRECSAYDGEENKPARGAAEGAKGDRPERHHFVQAVNHLVVIVGWDILDDGTEVWLVQNSWGPEYCENGVIKVAMGSNEYAIETEPLVFYWWPNGAAYADYGMTGVYQSALITLYVILGLLAAIAIGLLICLIVVRKRATAKRAQVIGIGLVGETDGSED